MYQFQKDRFLNKRGGVQMAAVLGVGENGDRFFEWKLMYKLTISKEQKNTLLGPIDVFQILLEKVNKSLMQCWECNCITDSSIWANHLLMLCWAELTIDRIGLNGVLSLCIWGSPQNEVFVIKLGVFFHKSFLVLDFFYNILIIHVVFVVLLWRSCWFHWHNFGFKIW